MRAFGVFLLVAAAACFATLSPACDASDGVDYRIAAERAKTVGKPLLLAFLGTDWSLTSLRLDREVFDQQAFADNETYEFLLCKIHFYQTRERPPEIEVQNRQLAERFGITEFPTVVVLDVRGDAIGRLGYGSGGVAAFGGAVNALLAGSQR